MTSPPRTVASLLLGSIAAACLPALPPLAAEGSTGGDSTTAGTAGTDTGRSESSGTSSGSSAPADSGTSPDSGDETGSGLHFALNGPCIDAPDEQLSDFIDLEGITCTFTEAPGNGRIPQNVTLDGCDVSGEPLEFYVFEELAVERFGSWAFVLEVSDAGGATRMVPICVTHDGTPARPDTLQVLAGVREVPVTAVTTMAFSTDAPVGLAVGPGPAFVIDRVGKDEEIEHEGLIGGFTPGPIGDPQLAVSEDQFSSPDATYRLHYPEQTLAAGDWDRPFVSVVDVDLCADYATSAACTMFAMYNVGIAVSHAVIFEPE